MDGCLRARLPVLWRNELKNQEKGLAAPPFAEIEEKRRTDNSIGRPVLGNFRQEIGGWFSYAS
jgi:hypothetical protein